MLKAAGSEARGILELEWLVVSGGRAWTARLALLQVPQQMGPPQGQPRLGHGFLPTQGQEPDM